MKRSCFLSMFLLLMGLGNMVSAQTILIPLGSDPAVSFSKLWNFHLILSGSGYTHYYVETTFSDAAGKKLFVAESKHQPWSEGSFNFMDSEIESLKPFRFTHLETSFSDFLGTSDPAFPEGEYLVTYRVLGTQDPLSGGTELFRTETAKSVMNFVSIQQLSVADNDTITEKNPFFIWTPIDFNLVLSGDGNGSTRYTYSIRICKILEGQSREQALLSNIPVCEKTDLTVSNFAYPVEATLLENESSYAWQVAAYSKEAIVAKSEVWIFHYSDEKRKRNGQFVWMNRNMDMANCVVKDGQLLFAYEDLYAKGTEGEIVFGEIYTEWGQKFVELDDLKLPKKQGTNMIKLDLCGGDILLGKGNYTLVVYNGKNEKFFLNFTNETVSCNE